MFLSQSLFLTLRKPIIGMIHLPALPGSPGHSDKSLKDIVRFALQETRALEEGGVDALLVENFHDYPYLTERVPTQTVIAMAAVAYEIRATTKLPLGVNILFNDTEDELYLAKVLELDFMRVEGFVDVLLSDLGMLMPAAPNLMRLKKTLRAEGVAILADVQGKYTHPLPSRDVFDSARDALERGNADAVILTGTRTGEAAPVDLIRQLKEKNPQARVLLGSGITPNTIKQVLDVVDGAIVGSFFKENGNVNNPVDSERVRTLMEAVRSMRGSNS